MQSHISTIIAGVVTWELQTDMNIANNWMKIANSYENCQHPCRNYTPKCENCKLIWNLQTDMKIANWNENCKSILMFWCIVPAWMFGIFIWDTVGIKWSYFIDLLHFIHDRSAQLVRRQRRLEAKMISLRATICAISSLLVGVGTCANFWYQK